MSVSPTFPKGFVGFLCLKSSLFHFVEKRNKNTRHSQENIGLFKDRLKSVSFLRIFKENETICKMSKSTTCQPLSWFEFEKLEKLIMHDIGSLFINNQDRTTLCKMGAIISIGCYTGLRHSDLRRLTWSDVLQEEMTIIETKTKKERKIYMNPKLRGTLRKIRSILKPDNDAPIMPSTVQWFNRLLKKMFALYQVKVKGNASSHTLRKTFGRRVYVQSGESERALVQLSEIFNHSDISTTRKYIGLKREIEIDVYKNLHV